MDVEYDDKQLQRMAEDKDFPSSADPLVKSYRKRIQLIKNAPDERDFYALKSLHFEKLKGDRQHRYSMRLNEKWRLILELRGSAPNKKVAIIAIEDYH